MSIDTVTLRLKVEHLGVTFHPGTKVRFSYRSRHTRSTVFVSGHLEGITRGAAGHPTLLLVDRVPYTVPAGTLVTVETGELR